MPEPIIEENEEPTIRCVDCGETVPEAESECFNDENHCNDCVSSKYRSCERCDERVDRDHTYTVHRRNGDEEEWCFDCKENHTWYCEDCDDRYASNVSHRVDNQGRFLCADCYANDYFTCPECREVYIDSEGRYHEDRGRSYCESCYDDLPDEDDERDDEDGYEDDGKGPGAIHNYSHKPRPIFHGNRKHEVYGVELEVNAEAHTKDHTLRNLGGRGEQHVYLKSDSSIGVGYEIVSHPHTMEEHRKLWDAFLDDIPNGMTSYKSGKCGMHVHIERAKLTRLQIGKMLVFLNAPQNSRFITLIAQRSSNGYSEIKDKKITDSRGIEQDHDFRYEALNLTNRHTIEVRIFRGTVRKDRFWKNMEFVEAMVRWTRDASYRELSAKQFCNWVRAHRAEYKYLFNYLVEIGYTAPLVDPLEQARKEILAQCA